jgi:hypothetical protein
LNPVKKFLSVNSEKYDVTISSLAGLENPLELIRELPIIQEIIVMTAIEDTIIDTIVLLSLILLLKKFLTKGIRCVDKVIPKYSIEANKPIRLLDWNATTRITIEGQIRGFEFFERSQTKFVRVPYERTTFETLFLFILRNIPSDTLSIFKKVPIRKRPAVSMKGIATVMNGSSLFTIRIPIAIDSIVQKNVWESEYLLSKIR